MVDLRAQQERIRELAEVLSHLVGDDLPEEEAHAVVASTYAQIKPGNHSGSYDSVADDDQQHDSNGLPIYDDLPDGLIDLPAAAAKYARSIKTLEGWLRTGRLRQAGRVKAPAPGGGYRVVEEADIVAILRDPPKRGRPKHGPTGA